MTYTEAVSSKPKHSKVFIHENKELKVKIGMLLNENKMLNVIIK